MSAPSREAVSDALAPHVLWHVFGPELFAAMPEGYRKEMERAAEMEASIRHQLGVVNAAREREGKALLTREQFLAGVEEEQ